MWRPSYQEFLHLYSSATTSDDFGHSRITRLHHHSFPQPSEIAVLLHSPCAQVASWLRFDDDLKVSWVAGSTPCKPGLRLSHLLHRCRARHFPVNSCGRQRLQLRPDPPSCPNPYCNPESCCTPEPFSLDHSTLILAPRGAAAWSFSLLSISPWAIVSERRLLQLSLLLPTLLHAF